MEDLLWGKAVGAGAGGRAEMNIDIDNIDVYFIQIDT